MATCEILVFIDADGNYGVGRDEDDAKQNYDDNVGGQSGPMRMVQLSLNVAPPVVELVNGDVPLGAKGAIELAVG